MLHLLLYTVIIYIWYFSSCLVRDDVLFFLQVPIICVGCGTRIIIVWYWLNVHMYLLTPTHIDLMCLFAICCFFFLLYIFWIVCLITENSSISVKFSSAFRGNKKIIIVYVLILVSMYSNIIVCVCYARTNEIVLWVDFFFIEIYLYEWSNMREFMVFIFIHLQMPASLIHHRVSFSTSEFLVLFSSILQIVCFVYFPYLSVC